MITVAEPARDEIPLERVETRRQFCPDLVVELHAQQGRGIAFDERPLQPFERRALAGVIEDEPIHHFDRRRPMGEDRRRRLERLEQVGELNRHDGLESRQRHQRDPGFDDDGEGAFGADRQLRHVERRGAVCGAARDQRVQVVAADPPQHFRIPDLDLLHMLTHGAPDLAITGTLQRIAGAALVELAPVERPEMRERSVREHDVLLEHVVDRLAVEHRARPGRVVRHHAADGGATRRRDVGRKAEPVLAKRRVQLVQHDTRLDPRPAPGRIHLEHPVEVLRRIDDDAAADGLAGLRRTAASHRQGASMLCADRHGPHDVVARLHDHDAERRDLVDARVGRIQRPRDPVEADFAFDRGLEIAPQRVDVHQRRTSVQRSGRPWTGTTCEGSSPSFRTALKKLS